MELKSYVDQYFASKCKKIELTRTFKGLNTLERRLFERCKYVRHANLNILDNRLFE